MSRYPHDDTTNLDQTIASLIKSINTNTNTINQYIESTQENSQVQQTNDRTIMRDIGNNNVNVVNYIDPDTVSSALANNENFVANLVAALSAALSASFTTTISDVLVQLGLINVATDETEEEV